jgi:hypothetical protein
MNKHNSFYEFTNFGTRLLKQHEQGQANGSPNFKLEIVMKNNSQHITG